jgi:phage-related protein
MTAIAAATGVLEVVSDHRGDTFRSVQPVRFASRVFALTRFRRSRRTVARSKADIELIKQRLKQATGSTRAGSERMLAAGAP